MIEEGYVVEREYEGEEGKYMGDKENYDEVVMDIGMKKMEGIRVVERWRRRGRKINVIMMKERDRWREKVDGIDEGEDEYVEKNLNIEEVMERMREMIRSDEGNE